MKSSLVITVTAISLVFGVGVGLAAKQTGPGIAIIQNKSDRGAGLAALAEAERLAEGGSWELIAVGRVYYLSGDKARGQALFDRAMSGKPDAGNYQRLGEVYAEAGENDRAAESLLGVPAGR